MPKNLVFGAQIWDFGPNWGGGCSPPAPPASSPMMACRERSQRSLQQHPCRAAASRQRKLPAISTDGQHHIWRTCKTCYSKFGEKVYLTTNTVVCGRETCDCFALPSHWWISTYRSAHPKFLQQPPLSHHSYIAWLLTVIGNFRNSFDLFVNVETQCCSKTFPEGFRATLRFNIERPFNIAFHRRATLRVCLHFQSPRNVAFNCFGFHIASNIARNVENVNMAL